MANPCNDSTKHTLHHSSPAAAAADDVDVDVGRIAGPAIYSSTSPLLLSRDCKTSASHRLCELKQSGLNAKCCASLK